MRSSTFLIISLPLMFGQGCPTAVVPETRTQRAYRVCQSELGISADTVETVFTAAKADLQTGFSYGELVQSGFSGCDSGCGYLADCGLKCKDCLGAVADAVYFGDETNRKVVNDETRVELSDDCDLPDIELYRDSWLYQIATRSH